MISLRRLTNPLLRCRNFATASCPPRRVSNSCYARSWFFTKKNRAGIEKARTIGADVVVLDLEDSVAAKEKASVRNEYIRALDDGVLSNMRVFVRVSDLKETEAVKEDIGALARPEIEGFILPKVKHPDQVRQVEAMLGDAEKQAGNAGGRAKLVPLLEVPEAYFHADTIASSSERNVCVIVGSGDFTATAVCDDHSHTYDAFFSKCILAAKAAGIEAVCGVHDKLDDYAGLERFCIKMKRSGYVGALALTPKQIQIINHAFQYTPRELMWVDQVLGNGQAKNIQLIQPSVQESRQMVGPPHKDKANAMRERHETQVRIFGAGNTSAAPTIRGTQVRKGISPEVKLGEIVQTPIEVTITDSWKSLWETAFLSTKGYFTSLPRSKNLGFEGLPLPFSLATTMAIALSVSTLSYYARVHLCFRNVFQQRALLAGDTVRAMFCINNTENKKGSDGSKYCIAHSTHWLVNQRDEIAFQVDKTTMFSPSHCNIQGVKDTPTSCARLDPQQSVLRQHLLCQPEGAFLPHLSLPTLLPGQLLVHDFVKIMGESEVRMLCTLLNIVNPHHHNKVRYQSTDLLVPGPFVMSAAIGSAALDIGEIIYEDIPLCVNPNKVNFGDQLGALTYVESVQPLEENPQLEEVQLKHVALKNTDMEILSDMDIPKSLFEGRVMKPSEYESLCANEFPLLLHKIACVLERRIIRVRPGLTANKCSEIPKELLPTQKSPM